MIKFFRKIRQNLLSEEKTGKYTKYAIGEILLVVIGILIALQINNSNELRKQKDEEAIILSNIKDFFLPALSSDGPRGSLGLKKHYLLKEKEKAVKYLIDNEQFLA